MENELPRLSNRGIVMVLFIIPVACLLALIISSVILPGVSWPPDPPLIVATIAGPIVIVGFIIYASNFKDERSVQISDKASRNGFIFMLYALPLSIIVLSLTGASIETMIIIIMLCIGMIAVAGISAFYYYHK